MLTDGQVQQAAESLWRAEQTSEWAQPRSVVFPEADVGDALRNRHPYAIIGDAIIHASSPCALPRCMPV